MTINTTINTWTKRTWDNLAIYVADDDFIEHLHEMGFTTLEEVELYEEWGKWSAENVEIE